MRSAVVNSGAQFVLTFPSGAGTAGRREFQKCLLQALLVSELPVIVDLSDCRTLDQQDIDSMLRCVAQAAGRDTPLIFVAGSGPIRVLLEVTRIASVVPVFDSMEEALVYPRTRLQSNVQDIPLTQSQLRCSA